MSNRGRHKKKSKTIKLQSAVYQFLLNELSYTDVTNTIKKYVKSRKT